MSLIDRIGSSSTVMRLLSDDRVMKVTTGVMDAKSRFSSAKELATQALLILRDGHAMPTIDPALDGNELSNGSSGPQLRCMKLSRSRLHLQL